MSATDRLVRVESLLTGRNAWQTGGEWLDQHMELIYTAPSGRKRDLTGWNDPIRLQQFATTLDGTHKSVVKHIRDYRPLQKSDWIADMMIGLLYHLPIEMLISIKDDQETFLYRMMIYRGENLPTDGESWLYTIYELETTFAGQADQLLRSRTDNKYSLMLLYHDDATTFLDCSHCDVLIPYSRRLTSIQLQIVPNTFDWRQPATVHATIMIPFAYREHGHEWEQSQWYVTPEQFVTAIIRIYEKADHDR